MEATELKGILKKSKYKGYNYDNLRIQEFETNKKFGLKKINIKWNYFLQIAFRVLSIPKSKNFYINITFPWYYFIKKYSQILKWLF